MRITTTMLRELEQAIAPDAEAEIRIYAGGCDVRVRWAKGLREVNQNVAARPLATIQEYRDQEMAEAWGRLIEKFQKLRDMPPQ